MFFDQQMIDDQAGYPGLQKAMQRVNQLVQWLANGVWLTQQDAFIKEQAFALLLADPAQFLNVLRLVSLTPVRLLPNASNVPSCMQYLSTVFQTQRIDLQQELPERPSNIGKVNINRYSGHPDQIYANLTSSKATARAHGIETIRGSDKIYSTQQSLIFAPIIQRNRLALQHLVQTTSSCTAVFGLERGGALWSDYIGLMTRGQTRSIKLPKPPKDPTSVFVENIEKYVTAWQASNPTNPQARLTIGIAETMVSGGSANRVLKAARTIANAHSNVNLKLLFARHTHHRSGDELTDFSSLKVKQSRKLSLFRDAENEVLSLPGISRDGGDVDMFIANAQYLLGEDIDYQLTYNGQSADKPLVIFDKVRGQIKAVCISPSGGHTAREMLIRLVLGCYDETLAEFGIRL